MSIKPTTNNERRASNAKSWVRPPFSPDVRSSAFGVRCSSRQAVALIITLIMLAVITFLAIAFLVLSHTERGAVTTTTDQATAQYAADTAVERAKAELLANILATANDQAYDLMVSTNFINPLGFNPNPPANANPYTNVNYNYTTTHQRLTVAQQEQNLANLYYDPRPPVWVTNQFTGRNDFVYYLDLNRNGRYDTNGYLPVISPFPNEPFYNTNGTPESLEVTGQTLSNYFVGDPEWIGVLAHPEWPYSATNDFVARYAFLVAPAGKTLDLNYIFNQARGQTLNQFGANYLRNQGVGTWELNLAAFLYDLNTNMLTGWGGTYLYDVLGSGIVGGNAFADAAALLGYRYDYNYLNLQSATALFGPNVANAFGSDRIDEYDDGPLQTTTAPPLDNDRNLVNRPWVGADNPNHFFTPQDLFDPNKTAVRVGAGFRRPNFSDRLLWAGTNVDSYDRYTFYRMLAQLGTDSSAPVEDKMNLNYLNVDDHGNVVPGMETNLISWGDPRIENQGFPNVTPPIPPYGAPGALVFFTNAAQRMLVQLNLHDYYGNLISITNIPLYPTNYYSPAVNRALQLAANMYEATTNSPYPCIYRPFFGEEGTNIFIRGYDLINGPDTLPTPPAYISQTPIDLNDEPTALNDIKRQPHLNVYGVPWIIGAKKGFPNFNQATLQTVSQFTRKIQVVRPLDNQGSISQYQFKQMMVLGIKSSVAVEVWNSYRTNYPYAAAVPIPPRPVYIQADGDFSGALTNLLGPGKWPIIGPSVNYALGGPIRGAINIPQSAWQGTGVVPGSANPPARRSFQVPLLTNLVVVPDATWLGGNILPVLTNEPAPWNSIAPDVFPQADWVLTITNHLRCMILDGGPPGQGRVVDYVQLTGPSTFRNLNQDFQTPDFAVGLAGLWSTNIAKAFNGVMAPQGVINQIQISLGNIATSDPDWFNNVTGYQPGSKDNEIAAFQSFMYGQKVSAPAMQVPFTPTAERYQTISWEANDPLVHYTADDLNYVAVGNNINVVQPPGGVYPTVETNLYRYNDRYDPWGGNPAKGSQGDQNALNIAVKDPMVRSSDDWDFPTNKFPNIGWLGRVHRGTPWQTVYLKASDMGITNFAAPLANYVDWVNNYGAAAKNWAQWSGDSNLFNAFYTRPVQDRSLFDLFTTAPDANAMRGQLSINQTNLAAWSAALSGVIVLTNSPLGTASTVIQPAGVYNWAAPLTQQPALAQIVHSIDSARANTNFLVGTVFTNQVFNRLGDILAVPALTYRSDAPGDHSPFLNTARSVSGDFQYPISDEVMERIPQQILSLLTLDHSPRFVIYAYGQTLKPAPDSVVTSGPYIGLCTNYQVTAETATRSVVRAVPTPISVSNGGQGQVAARSYRLVTEQYNVLPPD